MAGLSAIIIASGWAVCGWLTVGISLAGQQAIDWEEHPQFADKHYREDLGFAWALALLGPIGLLISFLASGFVENGFCWTRTGARELRERKCTRQPASHSLRFRLR